MPSIELIKGDITKIQADAIVNAANKSLLGGGGVDGAIHQAAGPELYEECMSLNGCPTGEVKLTKGYNLAAKHIIHAVGPIWHGGECNEQNLLASCYRRSLEMAEQHLLKSIAFPNISTGVYRFPKEFAANIAIHEVQRFIQKARIIEKVIFVVFDDENYEIYRNKLKQS